MRRVALLVVAAALLAGCVTVGRDIDFAALHRLTPGVSTRADAERLLGPPALVSVTGDGKTVLAWSYTHSGFAGSDLGSKAVTVTIGPDGRLAAAPTTTATGVDAAHR